MEIAVLGFVGSKNIGDYIQTKAVIDIVGLKNIKILDREKLDKYNKENIKTIINGWFMENPKNWPPSKKIIPLFISFHINPSTKGELLKKEMSLNEYGIKDKDKKNVKHNCKTEKDVFEYLGYDYVEPKNR